MTEKCKNLLSGGPIEMKEGWALIPFKGERVHYWKPDNIEGYAAIYKGKRVNFWKSLCGIDGTTYAGVQPLEGGNWPKCKRCMKKAI